MGVAFNEEAVLHHRGAQTQGEVLRITPRWMGWVFRLVVLLVVTAAAYSIVGTAHEYAGGPAVVRMAGRLELTARSEGLVTAIAVKPGQHVAEGDVLVTFDGTDETNDRDRVRKEFDLQLMKVLQNPEDAQARQALTTLRAEREQTEGRVLQRTLRAPRAAVVGDIRIRAGQKLSPGQVALTLVDDGAPASVLVLLPGHARPMLQRGAPLRLAMNGYPYEYRDLTITSVGDELVGPAAVSRYLGTELADTIAVSGPVVIVEARLPTRSFEVDGKSYAYFDGMQGKAEARVRTRSILVTIFPALETLRRGR